MKSNENLYKAKTGKNDEFYTQLTDIEKELRHYRTQFQGKIVYCPCDTPASQFFKYFLLNFKELGLKKLIATSHRPDDADQNTDLNQQAQIAVYEGNAKDPNMPTLDDVIIEPLIGNGDFRSDECKAILATSDIVVTNPPFSLFREFLATLVEHNKQFIILGNINAVTYKEVFPLIMANKLWLGLSISSGDREFRVPEHYPLEAAGTRVDDEGNKYIRVKGVRWFTNMDHEKRHERLELTKSLNAADCLWYDFYNAININKTKDIPMDFDGYMGVPITFLDKYNPEQFIIVNANEIRRENVKIKHSGLIKDKGGAINGKPTYARIVIKLKKQEKL